MSTPKTSRKERNVLSAMIARGCIAQKEWTAKRMKQKSHWWQERWKEKVLWTRIRSSSQWELWIFMSSFKFSSSALKSCWKLLEPLPRNHIYRWARLYCRLPSRGCRGPLSKQLVTLCYMNLMLNPWWPSEKAPLPLHTVQWTPPRLERARVLAVERWATPCLGRKSSLSWIFSRQLHSKNETGWYSVSDYRREWIFLQCRRRWRRKDSRTGLKSGRNNLWSPKGPKPLESQEGREKTALIGVWPPQADYRLQLPFRNTSEKSISFALQDASRQGNFITRLSQSRVEENGLISVKVGVSRRNHRFAPLNTRSRWSKLWATS